MKNKKRLETLANRLNSIMYDDLYSKDKKMIKDTYDEINTILGGKIENSIIEKINENLNYLNVNYEDADELVNLFDPIYFELKPREY